ncbi:MAG: YchJ family protein [Polaromonas sp.]
MTLPEQGCPCGKISASKKPLAFSACCARYLADLKNTPAPDAQTLMRSRYSAFVMKRSDYLLATWHASTRPAEVSTDDHTKWLGLEVRRHTVTDADHAQVEFVARYRIAGRGARIHELSRFVREAGRWYYLDGDLR